MNRKLPLLLLFLAWLLQSGVALAAEARVDPRIFGGKAAEEKASFLVVMREQADLSGAGAFFGKADKGRFVYEALRAQAEVSQAPLRIRLEAAGASFRSFYLVNMIEVEGTRALAEELAARGDISIVAPNLEAPFSRPVAAEEESAASPSGARGAPAAALTAEPNLIRVGAPDVWGRGFTGEGIVIGMADTGFAWDHPALKSHYRGFDGTAVSHDYNWHDAIHDAAATNPCGSDAPSPCDDEGHGTATASLAVGDDGEGNQIGVAPGARFIGCRNMDLGNGTPARYTECFQFFLAPTDHNGKNARPELAAHVINNSWGCPVSEGCTDPDVLKSIVENVEAAGIVVVASAGNDGPECSTISQPPAPYAASFSIGATTESDAIARFSGRGPITVDGSNRLKPDMCAPGENLRVASPPGDYRSGFTGTSGAAPHVTGAVALLWSAAPQLVGQVSATIELLKRTAKPLVSTQDCGGFSGSIVPNAVFGFGRLNVALAADAAAPPARPRTVLSPRRGAARSLAPRK